MGLTQGLENRAASWAFNKWIANSLRHWKTTLGGVVGILTCVSGLIHYIQLASTSGSIDLGTILAWIGGITTSFGVMNGKDQGVHDVSYDTKTGLPIPQAQIVP